ncbi:unnamed protein product [Phyllotreta striolata]|uniref:Solute carrier family 25 member 38 homolog n=1 Tax=Phyllotreta striolata TaxID=444603 RepID=A0A9N9T978_PHYSR|nr:unnamed protein product [Phyllotreta striolata]
MSNDTEVTEVSNNSQLRKFSSLKVIMAGAISGILSAVLLQPFNVMKTRLQNPQISLKDNKQNRHRLIKLLLHIRKHEHISVLWAGTAPTVMRSIPGSGIYFYIYDNIKVNFFSTRSPSNAESLAIGMLTRALTDICVIPLTVIKTRAESGVYKYSGVLTAIKNIYKNEGLKGLKSGLLPVLLRDCPMSGMYVMFYNQTQKLVLQDVNQQQPFYVNSGCAAFSGVLATIMTHPLDVLKTQMQLFPNKYSGIKSAITYIYLKHGMRGYIQGIVPRLLKRAVFAAISWPLYEKVSMNNNISSLT